MDSQNKNMTEMIQQSAMSIAKQTKIQKKPKISSPKRALMKKRREMIENNTPRDHIEYVEICKTIKMKAMEDIRKHNLDEIRENIEATKSLKKVRRTHSPGKNPDDNTTGQTRQRDPRTISDHGTKRRILLRII